MRHTIAVLGSTGSIGTQALQVARHLGLSVAAATGCQNEKLLAEQCREFKIKKAWISEKKYSSLKILLADTDTKVVTGEDSLCELAEQTKCDVMLNSLLGISGLKPTLAAINGKQYIALANKETLVAGGSIVMKKAADNKVKIIPVDSEHSAIFQCLGKKKAKKILLTASGGSFFGKDRNYLKTVTPAQALTHPNWEMGAKITIDSGTLMNKGLELIEAVWLFNVKPEQVEVIIHRESIIHSMVEFVDNAVIAELSKPDMRECIQYAITYPKRMRGLTGELNFFELSKLTFQKPDEKTFTLLPLARECIKKGGNLPAALNGANEAAVNEFLQGKISFTDIFDKVASIVNSTAFILNPTLDDIFDTDREARSRV